MNHAPLVGTTVTPDAMNPTKGDTFQRPTPVGWERFVVIDVRESGYVSYVAGDGGPRTVDPEHFRAILVALDMEPFGRMRTAPEDK